MKDTKISKFILVHCSKIGILNSIQKYSMGNADDLMESRRNHTVTWNSDCSASWRQNGTMVGMGLLYTVQDMLTAVY